MELARVYDELYGMIEDLKKKIAAMSSGDEVTITPALESGTKIADYTIGEDEGVLYAPTPLGLVFSSTETKIGTYNGADLFSCSFTGSWTQASSSVPDWLITDIDASDMDLIIFAEAITESGIVTVAPEIAIYNNATVQISTVGARAYTTINLVYTKKTETRSKKKK